jgi:tRNA-dihydrouridine synthase B
MKYGHIDTFGLKSPMSNPMPYAQGSLLFAPMEGVTDETYRLTIQELYPEWDYYHTDFLRVPTQGHYSFSRYQEHIGHRVLEDPKAISKTGYQILTTARAQTESSVDSIAELPITHLDLNLGCPSKKVNAHKGGAYLLEDLGELKRILGVIRERFPHHFSVKIRIGYKNTDNFYPLLDTISKSNVDSLIIHGRTREQLYKGKADWSFIKKAVERMDIPVIGNGDIWTPEDVEAMFDITGCYAVMMGRGALKTPWLASLYKDFGTNINEATLLEERRHRIPDYFNTLETNYKEFTPATEEFILGRFKSFSRYLFEDFDNAEELRSCFLRSQNLEEFNSHLDRI